MVTVGPSNPSNAIVLTNQGNTQAANYPFQFGRPFIQGQIPHAPQVLINGVPAASQADVKNRYPDGSAEFAVISVVIPAIAPKSCDLSSSPDPTQMPPYALWAAHGNSPVFNVPTNFPGGGKTALFNTLTAADCEQFIGGQAPVTMITTENTAASSPIGGQMGFTEVPPYSVVNGSMLSSMICDGHQVWCPEISVGFDEETGGQWPTTAAGAPWTTISTITPTSNGDASIGVTLPGGAGGASVYFNGVLHSFGPTTEPLVTQPNLTWGADGDHLYLGPVIGFDQMFVPGVVSSGNMTAVQNATIAYYLTPGTASPVECGMTGIACSIALSVTHRLVAGATKAFQLYNMTTAAVHDAGFDSNGNVDTAGNLTFCGTVANCRYRMVYDQAAEVAAGPQTATLTFQDTTATSTPMSLGAMEALLPVGTAKLTLTPVSPATGGGVADAGQMLIDGNCTPWTQGAVAQTMICADDTTARAYDIGFGDGFHPLRPRFYVTFWPGTSQVFVRVVAENDLATELEDLKYTFTVKTGATTIYSGDLSGTAPQPAIHWSQGAWAKSFWVGGTPPQMIDIDNNAAYLASTRFFPNFDPSTQLSIGNNFANYNTWLDRGHDIYDCDTFGNGLWICQMGSGGVSANNDFIGPIPEYLSFWLTSPSWMDRIPALNLVDNASAWPLQMRESRPGTIFRRGDTPGSGSGVGRTITVAGRPTAYTSGAADNWVQVGPIARPIWNAGTDHQPSIYEPAYFLTGDPWYLNELSMWAGISVFFNTGEPSYYTCTNQIAGCSTLRGPLAASGGMPYSGMGGVQPISPRDAAWTLRGYAEAAFAEPDGTPEKSQFRTQTNDVLAKWEGILGINGTAFDSASVKTWVESTIVPYYGTITLPGGLPGVVPPLHDYGMYHTVPPDATIAVPGYVNNPWMLHYMNYALGRAVELGFAAKNIQAHYMQYPINVIGSSLPQFLSAYYSLDYYDATSTLISTLAAEYNSTFFTPPTYLSDLASNFVGDVCSSQGGYARLAGAGLAMAVDDGVAGAPAAWTWYNANGYSKPACVASRPLNPMWAIIPRTDTNVLPAQSTATPP